MTDSRRNTLNPAEVAIIKALIASKRYTNQEIAGLINRSRGDAATDINPGRISNIKHGDIASYRDVSAAPEAEVTSFLDSLVRKADTGTGPMQSSRLANLLRLRQATPPALDMTETDQIECKRSFNVVMKTVAAFANNKGGYFLFGVENGSFEVVGLTGDKFRNYDLNSLNQHIRNQLGVGLEVQKKIVNIGGKEVGVLHIGEAHTKPVIFIQQADGGVAQGHIYYRYPGEDRLISPAELQHIIEQRLARLSQTVLSKHLANMLRFGIENSAVMNLNTGEIDGKAGAFLIDESLLPSVSFIKEGEFVETSGAPALKLIGEVAPANKVIELREVLENYPLSYTQMSDGVREATGITQIALNKLIRDKRVKRNRDYAYYAFRSNEDRLRYEDDGTLKTGTASIYNEAAVEFLISEAEKLPLRRPRAETPA